MQMSLAELNATVENSKIPVEVFKTTPLYLRQYQKGELSAELSAREGVLFTTGKFVASGSVELRAVDSGALPEDRLSSLKTEKLVAHSARSNGAFSFNLLSQQNKLESADIPGAANIQVRGHTITGRAFHLDAGTMKLVTKEPVVVQGRGRRLESASGLESNLSKRSFKLTGPVRGVEIPARRGHSVPRSQGRRANLKPQSRDQK